MKEIKRASRQIELEAKKNVEDFKFDELCFKMVFDMFNDSGVFVKAFNDLTTYEIFNKDQIELSSFSYGYVKEDDGVVYPEVDLILRVSNINSPFKGCFCFTLTPFNAKLDNIFKDAYVYSGCDKEITKCWRIILKNLYGEKWVKAFRRYCEDVRSLKESEVATKAEKEYLLIDEKFNEEINSI